MQIHKVPGNFHISSHDFGEAYQKLYYSNHRVKVNHKINHLSFGSKEDAKKIKSLYGASMKNELNGHEVNSMPSPMGMMYAEYVLDITEMEYEDTTRQETYNDKATGVSKTKNPKYHGF